MEHHSTKRKLDQLGGSSIVNSTVNNDNENVNSLRKRKLSNVNKKQKLENEDYYILLDFKILNHMLSIAKKGCENCDSNDDLVEMP